MPFDLTNAPTAYMNLMNKVFKSHMDKFVEVFFVINSRIPEEHTHHLRTALEVLRRNELYAKLSKCEFWL